MEPSPLTQQPRPHTFEPKVAELYLHLLGVPYTLLHAAGSRLLTLSQTEEDAVLPEGFWRELFLLNPDKKRLLQILEPLTADDLLQLQVCSA